MISSKITDLVSQYNGYLYDYEDKGILLLDSTGYHLYELTSCIASKPTNDQLDAIKDFFNNQSTIYTQTNIQEQKLNQIFFRDDIFKQKDPFAFFLSSILELLKSSSVQLILKFDEPPQSWIDMLKPLTDFFKSVSENTILCILSGQFSRVSEQEKDFLYQNGFHLEFTHLLVGNGKIISNELCNVISDFAEYGFRIPIAFYVNATNVNLIRGVIDRFLQANYNSGFLLPLLRNPNVLPSRNDYLSLLTDVYNEYPYYDDIMYPLNEILINSISFLHSVSRLIYDTEKRYFCPVLDLPIERDVNDFFKKLFIWQRHCLIKAYETDSFIEKPSEKETP
jgi:hypothetical protein